MRKLQTLFVLLSALLFTACGAGQPGENNHPSKAERAQSANANNEKTLVWGESDWDSSKWE